MKRCLQGDESAKTELFNRYYKTVYAIAYKRLGDHDWAESVTQETFLRLFDALPQYRPEYQLPPWLKTITRNQCRGYIRIKDLSMLRIKGSPNENTAEFALRYPALQVPDTDENPLQHLVSAEQRHLVRQLLDRLRPEYRTVLILRYYQKRSYQEIAQLMGIATGTVGTYLNRASKELASLAQNEIPRQFGVYPVDDATRAAFEARKSNRKTPPKNQ